MELNSDQSAAFDAVKAGENIFLTGPAGAGKSFLIQKIVGWAEENTKPIGVTALTGCAALLLGIKAKTLHSWAGIGLGRESADVLAAAVLKLPKAKQRWKKTQILIIDEISMMTPELFDKLDYIGKRVRGSGKPWGGIQLVLCGDFFQLPPVVRGISGESAGPGRFAFESKQWKECKLKPVILSKIERQTDAGFQRVLNECRIGEPSAEAITLLKSRQGLDWKTKFIRPTLLFSRNADVDTINEKNIAALEKPLRIFDAETKIVKPVEEPDIEIPTGEQLERFVARLDNDANYCPHLELCVGAQVMLLTNLDLEKGLANGSRGVVTDFRGDGLPIVQFRYGDPIAIDYQEWRSNDCAALYRKQIPLRVAYAVTIHKSQGATLDCALVDIGSTVFEYGQAYVALSRVRDMESLYIHTLTPDRIKAHPTVVKFYMNLMEAEEAPAPVELPTATENDFGNDLALTSGWHKVVRDWAASPAGAATIAKVEARRAATKVYPASPQVLEALRLTPINAVKVVILGQDPYHGYGQAHGLSFSVQPGIAIPPSLRNIRKELLADLALPDSAWPASIGTLTPWAKQGVLMLNAILTVEEGNPESHGDYGWQGLTHNLLSEVVRVHADDPLVFIAWGKKAQAVAYKLTLAKKHRVVEGVHPSPLSAHSGFFGSKPFSKANAHLEAHGATTINWASVGSPGAAAAEDPN